MTNSFTDLRLFLDQIELQKFVVLEFSNGGEDLEHITLNNATQGVAVFWQVAHALAGTSPRGWHRVTFNIIIKIFFIFLGLNV